MKYDIKIYEPTNTNPDFRFALGTKGINPLFVFGLNPSTADDKKSDRTISKIMSFASLNNFDSFIMCNLYPQRATHPSSLDKKINLILHKQNISIIKSLLNNHTNFSILGAWGNNILDRYFLADCLKDIFNLTKDKNNWFKLGELTKLGHPRHPSRISYQLKLTQFDIYTYINKL